MPARWRFRHEGLARRRRPHRERGPAGRAPERHGGARAGAGRRRHRRGATRLRPAATAPAATTTASRAAASRGRELDVARPDHNARRAEDVIRKVRAGLMPPAGARRPDAAALAGVQHRARHAARRGGGVASHLQGAGTASPEPARVPQRRPRSARGRRRRRRRCCRPTRAPARSTTWPTRSPSTRRSCRPTSAPPTRWRARRSAIRRRRR